MAQVGRISGPLLFANLERQGIDLAFRNDLQTNQLLYLDVTNNRIGIDLDTPGRDVEVSQTFKTSNLISNSYNSPNFSISGTTISATVGNLNLSSQDAVRMGSIDNGTLRFSDNTITSVSTNSSIDLDSNGTGAVNFQANTRISGDLFTPKNIQLDGTINLGNQSNDTVDFASDVDSDLIPDETNTYRLGTPTKRWNKTFTKLLNGESVSTNELSAGQIDFNLRQGNIFYVAKNGDDSAYGDHPLAPFKTIKRALSAVDASSQGPVSIHVFPGVYEEQLPLIVPNRVSIIGNDLRSVVIKPDSQSQTSDVFLLDGDTTIENLTIRDFFFDDNQGYAFRFRPDGIIESRSPYINNVTVVTKGSATTSNDPRGFDSGDAGQGAYIDGAELSPLSQEASMLFNSCTFITPGVDAVTMTNGVRVEWLASFTYFANRGLYAFNNSTGRVTADGSTVKFGAEVRSIASANVYGNYGAVADGDDCLMYLIKHNFSYVGSGKNVTNDKTTAIQDRETQELNNGKIVFTSIDHLGTYRVGDGFFASFETGETSISNKTITGDELTNLRLQNNGDETFFDFDNFFTGNIEVNDNLLESFIGDINITAPSRIELKDNTTVGVNLAISGDLTFGGNLNLFGNEPGDTVDFNTPFDQNFVPNQNSKFDLGKTNKKWQAVRLSNLEVGSIKISDSITQTVDSNADIDLRANGSGSINFASAAEFGQDLVLLGNANLQNLNTLDLDIEADINFSGVFTTDNFDIQGRLDAGATAEFENIKIYNNVISTVSSDSDLQVKANSSGRVVIDSVASFAQNLSTSDISVDSATIQDELFAEFSSLADFNVTDNSIRVQKSNADLALFAPVNSDIVLQSNLFAANNLSANSSNFQDIEFTGNINHTGNKNQIGNAFLTGQVSTQGDISVSSAAQFNNIRINNNTIHTVDTNSDLELRANGSGKVLLSNNSVDIVKNLSIRDLSVGNITLTGTVSLDEIDVPTGNIEINDNYIQTEISNSDLELRAQGSGVVNVQGHNSKFSQNFAVAHNTATRNVNLVNVNHTGNYSQSGNKNINGNVSISNALWVENYSSFENIDIVQNTIKTTDSNSNLELRAIGTGKVSLNQSVAVNNNLSTTHIASGTIASLQNIKSHRFSTEDIFIEQNYITTTQSNSDLEFRASGSGRVFVKNLFAQDSVLGTENKDIILASDVGVRIDSVGALQIPTGSTSQIILEEAETLDGGTSNNTSLTEPTVDGGFSNTVYTAQDRVYNGDESIVEPTGGTGDIRFNTDVNLFEGFQNATISFGGLYSDDRQTSLTATANTNVLELRSAGNLVGTVLSNGMHIDNLQVDDININSNIISTTVSNSDLDFRPNGIGQVRTGNIAFTDNKIKNLTNTGKLGFAVTGLGYQKIRGSVGVVVPTGTNSQRPSAPTVGETRWNTTTELLEVWDGSFFVDAAGTSQFISQEEFDDLITEYTIMFG